MKPLTLLVLAFRACLTASCNQPRDRPCMDWRKIVSDRTNPWDREEEILASHFELGPEDILWLQAKVTDPDWVVRLKAVFVLGRSGSDAAAWSIWVASEMEELDVAYCRMVLTLGRMGKVGKPYLVRLLHDRGLTHPLMTALAQASGVRLEGGFSGFEGPADEWWKKYGKAELGHCIPAQPVRPAPEPQVQ